MKGEVTHTQPTITLELTLDEYKVINGLRYQHLGGTDHLRKSLEAGFHEVDKTLGIEPDYRRAPGRGMTSAHFIQLHDGRRQ